MPSSLHPNVITYKQRNAQSCPKHHLQRNSCGQGEEGEVYELPWTLTSAKAYRMIDIHKCIGSHLPPGTKID
jgi:hypothetical protein